MHNRPNKDDADCDNFAEADEHSSDGNQDNIINETGRFETS